MLNILEQIQVKNVFLIPQYNIYKSVKTLSNITKHLRINITKKSKSYLEVTFIIAHIKTAFQIGAQF